MASTIYSYNLTGGRVFPVAFEYLARRFVRVTLVGTSRQELQLNVDYRFISKTEIETTIVWAPGEFQTIEIRRVTSATDRLVNFTDGSILRSQDLNISQIQAIHIAEEGRDVAENSMISGGLFWDALGLPINNVGNPSLPTDAANGQYVLDNIRTALRVAPSETITEIPSDRANKVLAFDSNRQPVAIIPSAESSMRLELDLLDPSKGGHMIGLQREKPTGQVKDLATYFSTTPLNIYEFVKYITDKPDPLNPASWDWAPAIQKANDVIRAEFNTYGPGCNNVIVFPGGVYTIRSQVIISPFVKLLASGQVVFRTFVAGKAAVHFTPSVGDYSNNTGLMKQQQWWRGPFLSGHMGGFVVQNQLDMSPGTFGFEFGPKSDLGAFIPFARYAVGDFSIEGYTAGIKMNRYRNYIGKVYHAHIENNREGVVFGEPGTGPNEAGPNVVDSGENIVFDHCTIAKAQSGFRWHCEGFDLNLTNVSMDYNGYCFRMSRLYRHISWFGGHVEGIGGVRAHDGIGGIILEESDTRADDGTRMSFEYAGVSGLVKHQEMFKGSNKLTVSLSGEHRRLGRDNGVKARYFIGPNVVVKKFNMTMQGREIMPSESLNALRNGRFKLDEPSTGVAPKGFTVVHEFITYNIDTVDAITEFAGSKCVNVIASDTLSGYFRLVSEDKLRCKAGDDILTSLMIRSYAMLPNIELGCIFYGADGTEISKVTKPLSFRGELGLLPNDWSYPLYGGRFVAPPGTASYAPTYQIAFNQTALSKSVRITDLYACVLN